LRKWAGASLGTWETAHLVAACVVCRSALVGSHLPASVGTSVRLAGAVMVGFSWSLTVTICVAVAGLPLLSVTVQVTVVSPLRNSAGASLETLATAQLSPVTGLPRSTPVA